MVILPTYFVNCPKKVNSVAFWVFSGYNRSGHVILYHDPRLIYTKQWLRDNRDDSSLRHQTALCELQGLANRMSKPEYAASTTKYRPPTHISKDLHL